MGDALDLVTFTHAGCRVVSLRDFGKTTSLELHFAINLIPTDLLANCTPPPIGLVTPGCGETHQVCDQTWPGELLGGSHQFEATSLPEPLPLRWWCEAKQGMSLVYDFMSKSSLDKWLHPSPNLEQGIVIESLSWDVRRSILAGVASVLEYLHEDCVQCVLHRDIKYMMLDEDFKPYLGDFGLARLEDHRKRQKTTMLAGTRGYTAPKMQFAGRATKETDVYAFGVLVLVLEVVRGRTPFLADTSHCGDQPGHFLLLERVWRAHEAENIAKMVDPKILDSAGASASLLTEDGLRELEMIAKIMQLGFCAASQIQVSDLPCGW